MIILLAVCCMYHMQAVELYFYENDVGPDRHVLAVHCISWLKLCWSSFTVSRMLHRHVFVRDG